MSKNGETTMYEQRKASLTPLIDRVGIKNFLLLADKDQKWPDNVDPLQVLKEAMRYMYAGNSNDRGELTDNPFKRGY